MSTQAAAAEPTYGNWRRPRRPGLGPLGLVGTVVVFGGSEGIGAAIADAAQRFGATVFPFSRSATGTDIRKRKRVRAALEQAKAQSGERVEKKLWEGGEGGLPASRRAATR